MDVFGAALLDFQNGTRDQPFLIHRDDGFTADDYPSRYFEADPWPHETPAIACASGPVLDVGCGAGRHLLWLERHRIEATGIDASKAAIDICRQRGCKSALELDIMSEINSHASMPAATIALFGNNTGIGGTFDGACDLFHKFGNLARSDGRLVVTGIDVAATDNPAHLAYHERNIAAGRRRGEIKMCFEYKEQTGPWIPWYHPEPSELEEIASVSGWTVGRIEILETGFFWGMLSPQP